MLKKKYFIVFFNLEINEENTFKHYLVFESVFFLLPLIKKKILIGQNFTLRELGNSLILCNSMAENSWYNY